MAQADDIARLNQDDADLTAAVQNETDRISQALAALKAQIDALGTPIDLSTHFKTIEDAVANLNAVAPDTNPNPPQPPSG